MTLRHRSYLVEAAPRRVTKASMAKLRPTDRLLVYHGTYDKEFEVMAHGIDALKVRSRSYNQGRHRGLFVAPDIKGAARFGRIIMELSLPARNMHSPLGWSGRIDTKREDEIWRDKYPKSFRPSLNAMLLSPGAEPQAIYVGLIRPKDIKGVYFMDPSSKIGPKMSLRDARARLKIKQHSVDLTNPRMSIADVSRVLEISPGELVQAISRLAPKNAGDIEDLIRRGGFGNVAFGEKAIRNLSRRIAQEIGV
jgi:hypothetical protein